MLCVNARVMSRWLLASSSRWFSLSLCNLRNVKRVLGPSALVSNSYVRNLLPSVSLVTGLLRLGTVAAMTFNRVNNLGCLSVVLFRLATVMMFKFRCLRTLDSRGKRLGAIRSVKV